MKALARLALYASLVAAPALAACASEAPAAQEPGAPEAQPTTRDDGRAQLVRKLEELKQPGVNAEKDTQAAHSVLDAIGGSPEMQRDGGLTDH